MSDIEVFDQRKCIVGEGPFYEPESRRVGWVDILGSQVLWRGVDGDGLPAVDLPGHVGAAIPTTSGELVVCLPDGPAVRAGDGSLRQLGTYAEADSDAGVTSPITAMRSNDAKTDPRGRLWVSNMAYDVTPGVGALYRLASGEGRLEHVVPGSTIGNGLGWSPDAKTMYYIDTPTGHVEAFDFDAESGSVENRRTLIEIPVSEGMPDGMCVDAAGGLWVALWDGWALRRYHPDGALDRIVEFPTAQVSSCAFVGDDLDLLIVTTAARNRPDTETAAGQTFLHRPGDVVGLPVPPFNA